MKIKLLYLVGLVLLCQHAIFSQCSFGNQPFNGTVQSICYNTEVISPNAGEVATAGVTVGTYVAVNVIKGYNYTVKTTNSNLGFVKRVTLFDSTSTGTSLVAAVAASNTTAISLGWTASFTGTLYVQFNNNSNGCASSSSSDTITIAYSGGNNTSDSPTAYGTDSWVGHVYDFSNAVATPPSDTNTFANYLGYFNVGTQNFTQSYGGSDVCFPYTANGTTATLRTDTFAVKYRMRSTLTGCYLVTISGDDGVRLTVDGVKVFDKWVQQSSTTYANVLVNLSGNSDLLFEYYEKNGSNDSSFSMTPFLGSSNSIIAPVPSAVCSGTAPGMIDGSAYSFNGAAVNPSINFQWQSSPDNAAWTNISGATSEDYTPPAVTTATSNVTVYYRRTVSAAASNASSCIFYSNSVSVTTSPTGSLTVPTANAVSGITCSKATASWSASANVFGYLLDVATDSGFTSILPSYNNLNVGNVTSYVIANLAPAVTYYYRVRAMNGCNTTASSGTISFATAASVPTTSAGSYKICIDSPTLNSITTASVNSGQYVILDVIQGYNYTFSVGDVFAGLNESLNILDASTNNNVSPTAFSSGASGTSITWTASFSGQIKIVLTTSDCSNNGATGGTMQLKLNSVGNTLDSQTAFGNDKWVGHIYNWTGGVPPGGTSGSTPAANSTFVTANYSGYYLENAETISQNFGGDSACFSLLSNGVNRTDIYTDKFAVRYRMKSSKTGCYLVSMNGDDGFRLYVDGSLVFDSWSDKGNTSFGSVLINLTGTSDLVFDYYENAGANVVGFSMTPFAAGSNTITAPAMTAVCSGAAPGAITGSLTYNGATANPTINFQWQSSPDNATWTDISGATLQNYTPPAVTTATANVTVYYRRKAVGATAATSGCAFDSNVVSITTSPGIASAPASPVGSAASCTQFTANWTASSNAVSYRLDVSVSNTFASFVTGYNNLNVGNVTSYNVTGLTAGTTYYFKIRAVNGCGTSTDSATGTFVTLSAPAQPGTITGTTPQCPSLTSQVYSIASVPNATTYTWTVPMGWSITAGAGTTSITVTTGSAGQNGNIGVTAGNSCGTSVVKNLAVTVATTTSVGGTLGGSAVVCADTNSTLFTLTGYTGSIVRWESSTDNFVSVVTSIPNTATTYTATNLNVTTQYRAVIKNGGSCAVNSSIGTVSIITNTWDGISWSAGSPTGTQSLIFAGDYSLAGNISGCSCQVNSGKNVTIQSGDVMTITNAVTNNGGALIFENGASLIQANNTPNINSGNITYKRITSKTNNFDYVYWSSPVVGQKLNVLVPNTLPDKYFSFGTTNWVYEDGNSFMYPPGKGYIIRVPKPGLYGNGENVVMPYQQPVQFVGVPNNGSLSLPINASGLYNLIGNPYPSALNAKAFLGANSTQLSGTIYFWTHNTAVSSTGYASADYASYNLTGGVGTGTASTNSGVNTTAPTGNIAAGQSFFALSIGSGPIVFDNTMRVGTSGSNAQFFRGTKSKTTAEETNRVWLNLTNTGGAFKQMLVGYVTGASNAYDSAYDGESFDGNSFVDFYSINENKNLVIQGRGLPFDIKDSVPLGYRTTIVGTFAISIDNTDGALSSQPVFIEDKLTNTVHNLKNGPYSFTTEKGTFNDRLVLRYTDKASSDSSLGTPSFSESGKEVIVSVKNHKIKVNSFDKNMEKVMVYDLRGSLLYKNDNVNANEFAIPNFHSSDQFLIVMAQLENGKWITKEIVFQ